jgi:4'-phosphopantetheinyl transferase EntD
VAGERRAWQSPPAVPLPAPFELDLPHGRCVGFALPAAIDLGRVEHHLHPDERRAAASLPERRRRTWVVGRLALRRSLRALGADLASIGPIHATPRGAPALPRGLTGSISHKDDVVVALAAPHDADDRGAVGIDVEWDRTPKVDVRPHVLRADEGVDLTAPWAETARETILRFSAKEAVYKALDRFVGRYVGFHEVALIPRADGTAEVALHLRRDLPKAEGPFAVDVHWRRLDGLVLTSARVSPTDARP